MFLDSGPGGGFPWWAFLVMPFMMIGMGLMMWYMMRMMMGMGGHGESHGPGDTLQRPVAHADGQREVESLRREVEELRSRLAAVERPPAPQQPDDKPSGSPGGEVES